MPNAWKEFMVWVKAGQIKQLLAQRSGLGIGSADDEQPLLVRTKLW